MKIDDIRKSLDGKYDKNDIDNFIEIINPFYIFITFLSKKTNISEDDIEKDFYKKLEHKLSLVEFTNNDGFIKKYIEKTSEISSNIAKEYDFDDYEKVGLSLKKIMEMNLSNILINKK
ncbi:hypothetical protein M0Q50_06060 [bacterium]|jgi:hypothetical protein|nr:hypothetical protein [bacterium]